LLAIEPPTAAVLRALVVEAVREAGALVLDSFRRPVRIWHKANTSPVTDADIAANTLLRERLMAATPAYGWLSEESENDPARLASKRVWIVDPIDGTRAFIAGLPDWAVAAALVEDGQPIVAALFAPVEDSLFVAAADEGATCNATPIRASRGTSLEGIRVAGPRRQLEALACAVPSIRTVPRIHSLALRLARVAQGALDAAFASGSGHDWDLAAADLLVHEAGGALTTLGGERLRYNRADTAHGSVVAAGRERHPPLLDVIAARPRNFL
jgi:myo-inositol-1(or 4)-monophosphatase